MPLRVARLIISFAILFLLMPSGIADARRHPRKTATRSAARIKKQRGQSESELSRLESEIAKYQSELLAHEKNEKRSQRNLAAFNRRTAELKATIARLEAQVEALSEQKSQVEEQVQHTTSTLDDLKSSYAASVRLLYQQGKLAKQDPNQILFSPEKNNDNVREGYYAHVIGEAHAMSRDRLDSMKRSLAARGIVISNALTNEELQIGRQA